MFFQKKYSLVISKYEATKAHGQEVEDFAALVLVAKARMHEEDYKGAINDFTDVLLLADKNFPTMQIYLERGICYIHTQKYDLGCKDFQTCIFASPKNPKAYLNLGICKNLIMKDSGTKYLDNAIRLDSKYFDAYLSRASFHFQNSNYLDSVADCNSALALEPTSIKALSIRGACNLKSAKYSKSIEDFSEVISLDCKSSIGYFNRAMAHQLSENFEMAINDFSIVLLLTENLSAYRNRSIVYWSKGDHENSMLDLYTAKSFFPEDINLRGMLAMSLRNMGKLDQCLVELSEALEIEPINKELRIARGNVHAEMGQVDLGLRDYQKVIHTYPTCTEALVNIGYIFQSQKLYKKAWNMFTMALTINPKCTEALDGRAVVSLVMDNSYAAYLDIARAAVNFRFYTRSYRL